MTLITKWFKKGDVFMYLLVFLLAGKCLMEKTVPPSSKRVKIDVNKKQLNFLNGAIILVPY